MMPWKWLFRRSMTMSETVTFEDADYVRVFKDEDVFEYYDKEVGEIDVKLVIEDGDDE